MRGTRVAGEGGEASRDPGLSEGWDLRRHLPWGGGNTLPGRGAERGLSGPGAGRDLCLQDPISDFGSGLEYLGICDKGAKPRASQPVVPENPHAEWSLSQAAPRTLVPSGSYLQKPSLHNPLTLIVPEN